MTERETTYGAPAKNVLGVSNHHIAIPYMHPKAVSGTEGLAVLEDGRYIVKAGTVYPANDSTAVGVVMNDIDVTFGAQALPVVIHGVIKTANMPTVPTANALAAMKNLMFVPFVGAYVVAFETFTKLDYTAGSTDVTSTDLTVTLTEGMNFRDTASTLANWTITGEATTKLAVTAITVSEDKKSVTFTVESDGTALVAGDVTVLAGAACIEAGLAMTTAETIATVA